MNASGAEKDPLNQDPQLRSPAKKSQQPVGQKKNQRITGIYDLPDRHRPVQSSKVLPHARPLCGLDAAQVGRFQQSGPYGRGVCVEDATFRAVRPGEGEWWEIEIFRAVQLGRCSRQKDSV